MKKKEPAESLKQILPRVLFRNLERQESLERIKELWRLAVSNRAAKHTKVAGLKRGVLVVNADSSMWIYELTLKKDEILNRLRKKEPLKELKEIRFRIGEFRE